MEEERNDRGSHGTMQTDRRARGARALQPGRSSVPHWACSSPPGRSGSIRPPGSSSRGASKPRPGRCWRTSRASSRRPGPVFTASSGRPSTCSTWRSSRGQRDLRRARRRAASGAEHRRGRVPAQGRAGRDGCGRLPRGFRNRGARSLTPRRRDTYPAAGSALKVRGNAWVLVGPKDFKSSVGHFCVRGGFDSHTFPPFLCARAAATRAGSARVAV